MGRSLAPSFHVEQMARAKPAQPERPDQAAYQHDEQAVLFTDIVGSTAFFEQHGDQAGMAMVERHNGLLFPMVGRHGGRIIKTIGDAIMAAFFTVDEAVRSAVAMQQQLKQHNAGRPPADLIRVRIGINFGTVICHQDDLFGDVVNAAARVEGLACGDQILISSAVQGKLAANDLPACELYDAVRDK